MSFCLSVGIELTNVCVIMFVDHLTTYFQRIRHFALLHRKRPGQEQEALDALIVGQVLLERIDSVCNKTDDLWMAA